MSYCCLHFNVPSRFSCKKGAYINYTDPSGPKKILDKIKNVKFYKSVTTCCKKADLIIIHTEWNEYKQLNFKKIVNNKKFKIYDLRNIYSLNKFKKDNIDYYSIGR